MKRQVMLCALGASTLAFTLMTIPANAHMSEKAAQQLSRKEVKQLIRQASSPEDYRRLASYFDQKAVSLEAEAHEHKKRADHDAATPGFQPKVPYAGGWIAHCRYLASEYRLEAKRARATAQQYRALAGRSGASNVHFQAVA